MLLSAHRKVAEATLLFLMKWAGLYQMLLRYFDNLSFHDLNVIVSFHMFLLFIFEKFENLPRNLSFRV